MSDQLSQALGLPALTKLETTPAAKDFGKEFRKRIGRLNNHLRAASTLAPVTEVQPLHERRDRLYKAYQKTLKRLAEGPSDDDTVRAKKKVLSAVSDLDGDAGKLISQTKEGRDTWQKQEANFDNAALKIGELEASRHPQATSLGKLAGTIRAKANDRHYQDAASASEQLTPKLEAIYAAWLDGGGESPHAYAKRKAAVLQARDAWVAARDQARQGLLEVKSSLRQVYLRDPQLPAVIAKAKVLDEISRELTDDLRSALDDYLGAEPSATGQLTEYREQAMQLVDSFNNKIEGHQLLAAVDDDRSLAPDLQIKQPMLDALRRLQQAFS